MGPILDTYVITLPIYQELLTLYYSYTTTLRVACARCARVAGCKGKGTTFSSVGRFVQNKYVYLSSWPRLIDLAGSRRLCGKVEAETGLPEVAWQHF